MATVGSSIAGSVEDQANNNDLVKVKKDPDDGSGESGSTNSNFNNNNGTKADPEDFGKTNLIVNYLPQHMTDEEFEDLFKKFGDMKSCKIVRNRVNGYSYGFGFVDFETHDQAIKAIDELNGYELETKKIKVAFARPAGQDIKQANLYIKNVPNNWTQDDVKKVFEPYGNIIQVRVLGNDRGVAFVLYDLRKQAEDALEALNGKTVDGCDKPFEIKFAADKKSDNKGGNKGSPGGDRGRDRNSRGGRNFNHNRNQNRQHGNQNSGQRSFFDGQKGRDDRQQRVGQNNQYNTVQYSGGAQYTGNYSNANGIGPVRQTNNRMSRYAPFAPVHQPLVGMAQPLSAPMPTPMTPVAAYGYTTQPTMIPFATVPAQPQMAAIQPSITQTGQLPVQSPMSIYAAPAPQQQMPMTYTPIAQTMNNMYSVASNNMNLAANLQPQITQQLSNMRNSNSGSSGGGSGGHDSDGVTLFVYNIGPDSDENELRSLFSPYGHVVKCNVVRKTPGGETKGFGFVTLKSRDQANAAISGLNGSMKNGRTLQVSLKK